MRHKITKKIIKWYDSETNYSKLFSDDYLLGEGSPTPQASLARSTLNRKYSECKPLKTDISDLQIPFFYNNIY